MKQTETFIVFRDKENGAFLTEYKNNETSLAFTAKLSTDIKDAATIPLKKFEEDEKTYEGLLQALNAEPLKVEYTLTTLDGEEPEEIKVDNQSKAEMLFDALDDIFGGDD